MSLRYSSIGLFCSLIAIAFAAKYASEDAPTRGSRAPANIAKEQILGPIKEVSDLKHTMKLRGPLSVQLDVVGSNPAAIGDVFVVRGTIASRKGLLPNANFSWTLPPTVELINGDLSGQVQSVSPEQPVYVELTLRKLTDENAQVHLMAHSMLNEMRFGDSALYNTDTLAKRTAVLSGALATPDKPADLKVFH